MLNKDEKKAITRIALLSIGWPLGLDRFYDGKIKDGALSLVGWVLVFGSLCALTPCPSKFDGAITSMPEVNPLIIAPLVLGAYGAYLVIRKGFRLLRQFEAAE